MERTFNIFNKAKLQFKWSSNGPWYYENDTGTRFERMHHIISVTATESSSHPHTIIFKIVLLKLDVSLGIPNTGRYRWMSSKKWDEKYKQ